MSILSFNNSDSIKLTEKDFLRIQNLIFQKAGINLNSEKKIMVYNRLLRRVKATKSKNFSDYLNKLETQNKSLEWQNFINSLTTNHTSFFRESVHFEILAEVLKKQSKYKNWQIWCCASSTGQEVYSLAMTIFETLGENNNCKIFATDIDSQALKIAKDGIYSLEQIKNLSQNQLQKFFLAGSGINKNFVKIKSELQNIIEFSQLNLNQNPWKFENKSFFDLVFCRNVMIYFSIETQNILLQRIYETLKPKGLLFTGHTESLPENSKNLFKNFWTACYSVI